MMETDIEKTERKRRPSQDLKQDTKLVNLVRNAIEASSDDSGWAHLAPVGSYIAKQSPGFDPRNYGYTKLGELLQAMKLFEFEERPTGSGQRSEEHTSELQSRGHLVCRLLLEKKKKKE